MSKIQGFTLSEVLITLGIIGVIAALTLPNLIAQYNNTIAETRLKKFYSVMNQAILQSVVVNGDYQYWKSYFNTIGNCDGECPNAADSNDVAFKQYLAPYLKIMEQKEAKDKYGQRVILYYFEDGSAFHFAYHENRDIYFYPQNPEKCLQKTDRYGICAFQFEFYPISTSSGWEYLYKKGMEPTLYNWNGNKATLYTGNSLSCAATGSGSYCTAIIQQNGWKIPKDYPRKIQF